MFILYERRLYSRETQYVYDFFYTYNIRYYDTDEFSSVEKETETVSDYEAGVVRHAVPGGIVVSSKVFEKEVYSDEIVRPTKKGALVSYTVPVQFSDEQVYKTSVRLK